jgi:two-component system, chemotaxis family, protein-glutamate methylesterase/glutaminase
MANSKIRVLLIDDSGFMRIILSDLLRKDGSIEVVATATNGYEGVEKVKALKPDVVITDMIMPMYDGLYVVQQLMKFMSLPIILLSSLDRMDSRIFDALSEGAFDFLDKPHEHEIAEGYPALTSIVREASKTDNIRIQRTLKERNTFVHPFQKSLYYDIIVIGASTGGPGAVELIINNLPSNLAVPVVIAQHMPQRFIESFAARLEDKTGLPVSVLRDGEPLQNHHIYLAPGQANIRIEKTDAVSCAKYVYDDYPEFNHPSIDCLFESVAEAYGDRAIGIILTGMGKDGTKGMTRMKAAGGLTIAQDPASCVVYGMPRVAYESQAATYQIPLSEIANFIINTL